MRVLIFFAAAVCVCAQIERPQVGMTIDAKGAARPVQGLAASATLGDPVLGGVLSIACSARMCLAKTAAAIVSSSGQIVDAPVGPAVIGIGEDAAYVYFSDARQLARWHDGQLEAINFTADGENLSLRVAAGGVDIAVRRENGTWIERISLEDGSVQASTPLDADGPVMLLNGNDAVVATAGGIRLIRSDGSEVTFDAAGVRQFFAMGNGHVQAVADSGMWVLCIEPGREQILLLSGISPGDSPQSAP
jgi:hypothetical protein